MKTNMFEYVTPVDHDYDLRYVAENMRRTDLIELKAEGCTSSPYSVLRSSCALSDEVYTALDTKAKCRTPIAIFGVGARYTKTTGYATVWLLGTPGLYDRHNVTTFLRTSKLWMDYFADRYGTIGNAIHAENIHSLRWLRWCGFRVVCNCFNPTTNELFYAMVREKKRRDTTACAQS